MLSILSYFTLKCQRQLHLLSFIYVLLCISTWWNEKEICLEWENNTAWKVSVFGVILVRIFQHSDWIRRDTKYLSIFTLNAENAGQSNYEYEYLLRSVRCQFKFSVSFNILNNFYVKYYFSN